MGNTAEVLSLLKLGKKKLIMAETRMNRVSSRYVCVRYEPLRWLATVSSTLKDEFYHSLTSDATIINAIIQMPNY